MVADVSSLLIFFVHVRIWDKVSVMSFQPSPIYILASLYIKDIDNQSWMPVQNGINPREFVFHRNHSLSLVISEIQTHEGELSSAWMPMMDFIYSTFFFLWQLHKNIGNHFKIIGNHGHMLEMTDECGRNSWIAYVLDLSCFHYQCIQCRSWLLRLQEYNVVNRPECCMGSALLYTLLDINCHLVGIMDTNILW